MDDEFDELNAKISELTGKLSDHAALSVKISEQSGELKVLTNVVGTMVTEFRDFKNGIGPRLQEHDKSISTLEANRVNDLGNIKAVNGKVDEHVKSHWQWITIMVGILGAVTALGKALHLF